LFLSALASKKDRVAANLSLFRAPPKLELYDKSEPNERYAMGFAQNIDDLREVQRLRFSAFTQEYQANIPTPTAGVDGDLFDAYCDHLIVRDQQSHEVVGTYPILDPH
jgi:putative hemolysin